MGTPSRKYVVDDFMLKNLKLCFERGNRGKGGCKLSFVKPHCSNLGSTVGGWK